MEKIIDQIQELIAQTNKYEYIEQLIYIYSFLYLKIVLDTKQYKQEEYKKKYPHQKIERLMQNQSIIIKDNWQDIYSKIKNPGIVYFLNYYFKNLEAINPNLKGIFTNIDFNKIENETLKNIIEILNSNSLAITNKKEQERLIQIIENIPFDPNIEGKILNTLSGNDFTPLDISNLISNIVDVKENESIADLTSGSGGLLLQTAKKANYKLEMNLQDQNPQTLLFCKLNFLLHNIYDATFFIGNTIYQNVSMKKFDVIVGNLPFSTQNNIKEIINESTYLDYKNLYTYGIPPASKSDYAFIQIMLQSLKETGKMVVILPLGVLTRGGAEENIRKNMLKQNIIETIILLPPNMFRTTLIKTCIIIFNKNKKQNDVLFVDASKRYAKTKYKNKFENSEIEKIIEILKERKTITGTSYLATVKEILENEGNLNVTKYVIEKQKNQTINKDILKIQIQEIEEKLEELKTRKQFYLKKLEEK